MGNFGNINLDCAKKYKQELIDIEHELTDYHLELLVAMETKKLFLRQGYESRINKFVDGSCGFIYRGRCFSNALVRGRSRSSLVMFWLQ